MSFRYARALVAILLIAMLALPSAVAAARPAQGGTTSAPITATATDALGNAAGTFTGTFTPTSAAAPTRQSTTITGTLTGTLTDLAGNVLATVTRTITLDVINGTGACQILDLTLGPLDLDVLGLVVHLDTVHLNITAVPGPGNLLGNLLCAVAGLLDSNNLGTALANLLNRILGLLGGL
jgi:hypothetical protein